MIQLRRLPLLLFFQFVFFAALLSFAALFRLHFPSLIAGFCWSGAFAWTSLFIALKPFVFFFDKGDEAKIPTQAISKNGGAVSGACGPGGGVRRKAGTRAGIGVGTGDGIGDGAGGRGEKSFDGRKSRIVAALAVFKWALFGALLFIILQRAETAAFLAGISGLPAFWLLFAFLHRKAMSKGGGGGASAIRGLV